MTEKSLKEIAEELGIEKHKLEYFVKKENIEKSQKISNKNVFDETAQGLIYKHFIGESAEKIAELSTEKPLNSALNSVIFDQLKIKDNQISELQKLLDQEQQLHAQSKQDLKQLLDTNQQLLEYKNEQESRGFFARLFKK